MTSSSSAVSDELASLHARVRHYESEILKRDAMIEQLQEQVRLLLAKRFAASSEKLPDGQLGLFNEAEATAAEKPQSDCATEVAAHRRARAKRAPLPEALERVDIEHRLEDSERTCPHHAVELERFGEVVSEQLDIVPAKMRVLRHIRGKYRCPSCEGYLRTGAMPAQPLPKSFASPGLLAFIVTAKYVYTLPLYRQHQQLVRIGVELSRETLARWTGRETGSSCWAWEDGGWGARSGLGWKNPGFRQTEHDPVACVSWDDAQAYVGWLSRTTGERYRLLSEAEWEYATRAGTTGPFHFGSTISTELANYDGNFAYGDGPKGAYLHRSVPVGRFPANRFGLHDVHGNVWEWVEDCWHGDYRGAPSDGTLWTTGGDCTNRVVRGGSWLNRPWNLRSAKRGGYSTRLRSHFIGFRVARALAP